MNSQQKIVNLMTICRKAGMLTLGFDAVREKALEGEISCVIVTQDISQKTLKEVRFFCKNCHIDIVALEIDSADMSNMVGKKVVVASIGSAGFAEKFRTLGVVTKPENISEIKKKSSSDNGE